MGRRLWKSLFTFLLTLVLTIGTIAALSMATAAKTETASEHYAKELRSTRPAVTELTAVVEQEQPSTWLSMGAFAAILAVPAVGVVFYGRSAKKNGAPTAKPAHPGERSYPSAVNR